MKIVAISDTHNKYKQVVIPECDILIHAGDATAQGLLSEITRFLKWMSKQPAANKIFVPGNHDLIFEKDYYTAKALCDQHGVILLLNNETVIDGVKFYGSPMTPFFCNWAFNCVGADIKPYWDAIPDDTVVLITHGPSRGVLDTVENSDEHYLAPRLGCPYLRDRLDKLDSVKLHIHGHIHYAHGKAINNNKLVCNVAICSEMYIPSNPPTEIIL